MNNLLEDLNISKKDLALFKIYNINPSKFNIGIFLNNIKNIDILKKIQDSDIFNLKEFTDKRDIIIAMKNMHVIISNDIDIISLAQKINIKTFAMLNKTINEDLMSVNQYFTQRKNSWKNLLAKVKIEVNKYRIKLKEEYLIDYIDSIKNNPNYTEEQKLDLCAYIYQDLLYNITSNYKYMLLYIQCLEKLYEFKHDQDTLAKIAIFYSFHSDEHEKAQKYWNKVIKNTKNFEYLFCYSAFQCKKQNFKEWLKYYDYRISEKEKEKSFLTGIKEWHGEKDTFDKILLIHNEQGFGDTILFSRYINVVKKLFKKVIFYTPNNLKTLMEDSFPDIEIRTDKNISADYQIFDMSLPIVLNSYPNQWKNKKWIYANNEKIKKFKKYFSNKTFNIGIYWDNFDSFIKRSTVLETFLPLTDIEKVKLYSLHIDKTDAELKYIDDEIDIVNIGKHFKDFSDTAAAIQNCDLIISTDSVILNLAGAMGKKTFGLFNKYPEYRWYKLIGEDTGWYKSVKPFQTKIFNNYDNVFIEICNQVKQLVKKKKFSDK